MRIFISGDTHGNTPFICNYLIPQAARVGADVFVQVGDFGYWEHQMEGVDYLDDVSKCLMKNEMLLYWLHGNHDKWSLCMEKYGELRTEDGFVVVRPNLFYIPQGHHWSWAETTFRSFGGAYSVDKQWRLEMEERNFLKAVRRQEFRAAAGRVPATVASTAGTLWFPEEQMTDEQFEALMTDNLVRPVQVMFSHDKPRGSNPGMRLKNDPECWPNQDKLQRAMLAHQPEWWFHGHLHHRYLDHVRCGDGEEDWTHVIGLGADDHAGAMVGHYYRTNAWCVLDVDGPNVSVVYADEEAA